MAIRHLTEKSLRSLRTIHNQEDYWDQACRIRGISFGVRVYLSGSKEFICRYRFDRTRRFLTLGDACTLGLAAARAKVTEIKSQLEKKIDPYLEGERRRNAPTISELSQLYLVQYAARKKDGGAGDKEMIERDILSRWAKTRVADVRRRDIIELLEHITRDRNAPVAANRTRAVLSRLFRFAVEREIIENSPCTGLPAKNREVSRQRVLNDSEIKSLWIYLQKVPWEYAAISKLMLLTAQRPSEVCGLRWAEIQGPNWHLPSERTKNAQPSLVPLSYTALSILQEIRQRANSSIFVFPTGRSEHVKPRTFQRFIQETCFKLSIPPFTPHDFRRTARTNFSKLRIDEDIRERLLNHQPGRIEKTYDIHDYENEKRAALEVWDRRLRAITQVSDPRHSSPLRLAS